MLFVKWSSGYKPSFCNNVKLKLKQKNILLIVHPNFFSWIFEIFLFKFKTLIVLLQMLHLTFVFKEYFWPGGH